MYSIGEFSKIGCVSTKTLRYYDEIGLLRPAYVDEENHYRYYEEKQVDELLLISELKSYDLRLEQIKAIMESEDSSLLTHFLKMRLEQIDCQIESVLRLKSSIERKVQEIQLGGMLMEMSQELFVEAKPFEPVWVMSKKATIEITQCGEIIGAVFQAIFNNGLQPAGPVIQFYLDREFQPEHAEIEVCVPIVPKEGMEQIEGVKLLDPGLCAMCTYSGVYSKLGKAYAAVMKWIEEKGYQISYAPFDVYLNNPQQVKNPEELLTQVWFPVRKA